MSKQTKKTYVSAVVSVYVNGPRGTPGLSTTITSISAESVPYSFEAVTVYTPPSARVDSSIRKMVFSSLISVDTRFDGGIFTVPFVHSTVGVGAPDNGIVILIGSPMDR